MDTENSFRFGQASGLSARVSDNLKQTIRTKSAVYRVFAVLCCTEKQFKGDRENDEGISIIMIIYILIF